MTHGEFCVSLSEYFKGQTPKLIGTLKDFLSRRVDEEDLKNLYDYLITTQSPARTIGIKDVIDAATLVNVKLKTSAGGEWPPRCTEDCPACGNKVTWFIGESDMCPACQFPVQSCIDMRMYKKQKKGDYPAQEWHDDTVKKCHQEWERKRVAF